MEVLEPIDSFGSLLLMEIKSKGLACGVQIWKELPKNNLEDLIVKLVENFEGLLEEQI